MAETILIALLGSVIPSLVWLAFWLLEDRCEPEPKWRIALTFLAGMAAVGLVLPLEQWEAEAFAGTGLLLVWAATEEFFKLGAAACFGLMSRACDEPLDVLMYLITAALGFAAGENALYLHSALHGGGLATSVMQGDLRFAGATLLHTLASGSIGLALAFTFYQSARVRRLALTAGVILAIGLHTLFNFFILNARAGQILLVFVPLWLGIALILALVERIKLPKRDYC